MHLHQVTIYFHIIIIFLIFGPLLFVESHSSSYDMRLLKSIHPPSRNVLFKRNHSISNKNMSDARKTSLRNEKLQPHTAKYSPNLYLLTSYDPLIKSLNDSVIKYNNNKTTGSTVELNLSKEKNETVHKVLKSSSKAIKLHDDMMLDPPKDGMVRVRMYFHQAIHDDPKLYGTGPWNYWGHGWGYEYGFDPKDYNRKRYQRGYTIEKAYGRDFCQNQTNCRRDDPKFLVKAHKFSPYMPLFIRDTGERLAHYSHDQQPYQQQTKTPDEILALLWKRILI